MRFDIETFKISIIYVLFFGIVIAIALLTVFAIGSINTPKPGELNLANAWITVVVLIAVVLIAAMIFVSKTINKG